MNFDTDFIHLPENGPATLSASIRYWRRAVVLGSAVALGLVGATAAWFFKSHPKTSAAQVIACAVKLGSVMPGDAFTSKGLAMSQAGAARSGFHLTFDDGPHPVHTPALLDWLKANHIQATFFLVGQNARRYPELVRRMAAEGHQIGNHTWSHANLTKLTEAQAHREIQRTHEVIVQITGRAPRLFRPPYGMLTPAQCQWLTATLHYETVLWNVDTEDWKLSSPEAITQRIERTLKPGGIILAHDIHPRILQALPLTLTRLQARGLKPSRLPLHAPSADLASR